MEILINSCQKIDGGYLVTTTPKDIFYVDGKGGQLGDRGKIGDAIVIEVKEEGVVVDSPLENKSYSYEIDYLLREDIAKQHTSQHIFSGIAYSDYGLNTVGFRMANMYTTVDLDSKDIDEKIVFELEKKVNDIISRGIELNVFIMDNDEAHKKEGLRKQIKDKIKGDIRFVEIPQVDIGACAGFHVKNTKDIKVFKIINREKIKGNYTRFYFLAGDRAIKDYNFKHSIITSLSHTFSCKDFEIEEMVEKSLEEKRKMEANYKNIALGYSEFIAKKLLDESEKIGDYQPIFYFEDSMVIQFLPRYMREENILVTGDGKSFMISSQRLDCKEFIKYLSSKHPHIKGGGSKIKGNFKGDISVEEINSALKEFILKG